LEYYFPESWKGMFERELRAMQKAARDAETKIKEVYATAFAVEIKSDASPVTAADQGADALIREELHQSFPAYAFLTEESADTPSRLHNDHVFIVDPLDGTKEFVARNGEFTTNIALAYQHKIVVGVINVPLKDVLYYAIKGQGAYKLESGKKPVRIFVSKRIGDHLRVLTSRSFFTDQEKALIDKNKSHFESITPLGAALKFCAIAEGAADLSYRMSGGTKEWDVAAGDLILSEAGGVMRKPDGTSYAYNRADVYNREGYILANDEKNVLL
jgi:3'(2'), 5'-bisphosphate nucleotidase